jgi:DNA polymerase-3 subunit gamma/tau
MTYIALYRKYRSQTFDDVIGQQPIVQTLKNAITKNRLAHAYLFSGPRGTGKTSVARILAKALNCRSGPTDSPCSKCDTCTRIRDGHSVDVIEIDAASNRGIDEIRDLREKVRYVPTEGKYKVYIIDEVHMLTSEAFNALLKTLEEPPSHVIFVLATTESQKVPLTISSRCQRLDFARIPLLMIMDQLKKIAKSEGFSVEDKALNLIARSSEGSMRDAISLLDQLISFSGKTIKFDDVSLVLGSVNEEFLFLILDSIEKGDMASSLSLIEKAVADGGSVLQITRDILGHVRYILLAKLGSESIIDLPEEYIGRLRSDAGRFSIESLKELIKVFSRAELDMKWHPHPRLILEVAVVEAGSFAPKPAASAPKPEAPTAPQAEGDRFLQLKGKWGAVLESVKKKSLFAYVSLHEGVPLKVDEKGSLVIAFKKGFSFHRERLLEKANKSAVETALFEVAGNSVPIECVISDDVPERAVEETPAQSKKVSADSVKQLFSGRIVSNQ